MKIFSILLKAKKYKKKNEFFQGISFWLSLSLGVLLLLFVSDNFLRWPAGIRLFSGILAGIVLLKEVVEKVFWPLFQRHSKERMALFLEEKYNIPENIVINACHFQKQEVLETEKYFAEKTIQEANSVLASLDLSLLLERQKIKKASFILSGILFLFVLYGMLFPLYLQNAFLRYVYPQEDIPPMGKFSLVVKPSEDIFLTEGDSLEIECYIEKTGQGMDKVFPVLVYQEGRDYLEIAPGLAQNGEMKQKKDKDKEIYHAVFPELRASFCWRIFVADTYTKSFRVQVAPFPKIQFSSFHVLDPEYAGAREYIYPGAPSGISVLPGSRVSMVIQTDQPLCALFWEMENQRIPLTLADGRWTTSFTIAKHIDYQVIAKLYNGKEISLAQNEISLKSDLSPQIEFVTKDLHRIVSPGSALSLPLEATDDYGIQSVTIYKKLLQETKEEAIETWNYLGPPGNKGPIKEILSMKLYPSLFQPGKTYILEAVCKDFCPWGKPGKSRPLLLRIKSWEEESLSPEDEMTKAFSLLRETILEQKKAYALTENLQAYLLEALKENSIPSHQKEMDRQQKYAKNRGVSAMFEFQKYPQGKEYAKVLSSLVEGEMNWVIEDILRLKKGTSSQIKEVLTKIEKRQRYILDELISLLGKISEKQKELAVNPPKAEDRPQVTLQESVKNLDEDLKEFTRAEERILEKSKTLLDKNPEDLTGEEEKILGELAREQEKWSKFLEEKLTDFSKLPHQDFSDSSIAQELNEVYQEIQLAAKSLYEKKIELAVPHEQSGLEKAESLIHNLEKWLQDTPDYRKWLMEEPQNQEDIPLAELPKELEDIVGELLDKEEEMGDDVEDVTSSWMDSLDKGAGWDTMDGPISNMSAKGVTGNLLPNQHEIGGRSGEGRTGKSHGQMVEKTAQGKGGRETPTRVTPGPFEQGSIEDTSKESTGGATGGGKLSGFAEEGLQGPAPTMLMQKMARLAENQMKIRQKAEKVATHLKKYRLPTGDLEMAIQEMKTLQETAQKGEGRSLRTAFNKAVDSLSEAKKAVKTETRLMREQNKLPEHIREEILQGYKEGFPRGYEDIISEYFKRIANE